MVCDLQGCFDRERGFELTDPCMLSKVGRSESGYGRTDRGLHGLVDFFRTHKCTPLCKALGLTDARVREQELVVEEALRKKENALPAGCSVRQAGARIRTFLHKINPHLERPYTGDGIGNYIFGLLPLRRSWSSVTPVPVPRR